jgi:hypothetical protein
MRKFQTAMRSIFSVAVCILSFGASAIELSKADATKLLTHIGFQKVQVMTIHNGVGVLAHSGLSSSTFNSPNSALIVAVITSEKTPNSPQIITLPVAHDNALGWFYLASTAVGSVGGKPRLWTTTGEKALTIE